MASASESNGQPTTPDVPRTCGLVMPISAIDGASAEHWLEVKAILTQAIEAAEKPSFTVKLVSDADETGIIQKRIVQNVYSSDIIVCDVSGKNPNVMFELGMRLAFDKPVVIVKDDKTDYSFDTGIIEHLTYPRDLRFTRIVDFKSALTAKVGATFQASQKPDHSPFLKAFGSFHVATLSSTEVSAEKLTLEMLDDIRREMHQLRRSYQMSSRRLPPPTMRELDGDRSVSRFLTTLSEGELANFADLLDSPEFMERAMLACDAPSNYASKQEFREVLRSAAQYLSTLRKG